MTLARYCSIELYFIHILSSSLKSFKEPKNLCFSFLSQWNLTPIVTSLIRKESEIESCGSKIISFVISNLSFPPLHIILFSATVAKNIPLNVCLNPSTLKSP
jgi:hypothetical protein